MNINGKPFRTIWVHPGDPGAIQVIDQRFLPHQWVVEDIRDVEGMVWAIRDMHVRGAVLIGVAAAYGMYLAALRAPRTEEFGSVLLEAAQRLKAARPTAVNLAWAVDKMLSAIPTQGPVPGRVSAALLAAGRLAEEEVERSRKIGEHGLALIRSRYASHPERVVNILTHCNAGWLACVDYGTATAPIYQAYNSGIPVHVWVDETRPWNQGSRLTAWELGQHGVPHTVIADNAGGHLMQHGRVDLAIVGADRATRRGDVANKIGTYLKALAAADNGVPFYVALPSSTFDWTLDDGVKEIPIEERDAEEVHYANGLFEGEIRKVRVTPLGSPASNFSFDVTPARLITGLITECGVCPATLAGITALFPEAGASCVRKE